MQGVSVAEIVVVDTNENAIAELTRALRSSCVYSSLVPDRYTPYPMDYSSVPFKRMFENHRRGDGFIGFDIVANFSAHKHVRSEKDIYSVEAMIRNNVINAKGLLDMLCEHTPEIFFCVSTDKAANPVNIMGASKKILEDLVFSYSSFFTVSTARFANVAFSNGSLPASFLERINLHQPLSAPTDTKRYFVSPIESGQICMMAMLDGMQGGNRHILFPKLDTAQMTTFDQIARDLLATYGYKVDECRSDAEAIEKSKDWDESKPYPVYFSKSDTSGEKGYEEFFTDSENINLNQYKNLGVIVEKSIPERSEVINLLDRLDEAFAEPLCTKTEIVNIIGSYLANFEHIETGKSLDGKM